MQVAAAPSIVSFVIPAYNEAALVGATIESIRLAMAGQDVGYEIVVANDDSSDATAAVARQAGARVIDVAHRQIAATRNAGARAAAGDLFIFVDADSLVSPALAAEALRAWGDGAVGGGATVRFSGSIPLYARLLEPLAARIYRLGRLASGAFLFCTRDAFEAVGGFDETLFAAEEAYMSKALRSQGRFVVVRTPVHSSGRKLRMYSAWTIFGTLLGLVIRGGKLRSRAGGDIWYDGRREGGDASSL